MYEICEQSFNNRQTWSPPAACLWQLACEAVCQQIDSLQKEQIINYIAEMWACLSCRVIDND